MPQLMLFNAPSGLSYFSRYSLLPNFKQHMMIISHLKRLQKDFGPNQTQEETTQIISWKSSHITKWILESWFCCCFSDEVIKSRIASHLSGARGTTWEERLSSHRPEDSQSIQVVKASMKKLNINISVVGNSSLDGDERKVEDQYDIALLMLSNSMEEGSKRVI